jgi:hypothetical protein
MKEGVCHYSGSYYIEDGVDDRDVVKLCGSRYGESSSLSGLWKSVTCKRCLKMIKLIKGKE